MGVNEQLKSARKKAHLTQEDVEIKTGINKKTISNWENGVSRPDVDSLAILCKLYKVNPNSIFDWNNSEDNKNYYLNDETARIAQEIFDNPDLKILFDATRKTKPEDLKLISDMVKRMSGEND